MRFEFGVFPPKEKGRMSQGAWSVLSRPGSRSCFKSRTPLSHSLCLSLSSLVAANARPNSFESFNLATHDAPTAMTTVAIPFPFNSGVDARTAPPFSVRKMRGASGARWSTGSLSPTPACCSTAQLLSRLARTICRAETVRGVSSHPSRRVMRHTCRSDLL